MLCRQIRKNLRLLRQEEIYCHYLNNELIIVKDIIIYDSVAHVFYVDKEFSHLGSLDSNIVIGCFVNINET